jgi:phospholipid transport system substrate-binding protein
VSGLRKIIGICSIEYGTMYQKSGKTMTIKPNTFFHIYLIALFVWIVVLSPTAWAGPGKVTDSLKTTLNQMIQVLNDPSLKTPDKKNERKNILLRLIKERFDEEEFARRALGSHWQGKTEEEKKEFVDAFSSLLEQTYLDKIDTYLAKAGNFSEENILYLNETVKGKYVIISTKILTGEDSKIPVLYLLKNKQGNWLVCDVAIEGVSIAKNYRAQFKEILANSSFKELITKLKSKQIKETTEKKK